MFLLFQGGNFRLHSGFRGCRCLGHKWNRLSLKHQWEIYRNNSRRSNGSSNSFFFFFLSFFVFFFLFSDESDELDSTSFVFFLLTARTPTTRLSTWPVTVSELQVLNLTHATWGNRQKKMQSHLIISQRSAAHHIVQWWWAQWACRQMWSSHLLLHPAIINGNHKFDLRQWAKTKRYL